MVAYQAASNEQMHRTPYLLNSHQLLTCSAFTCNASAYPFRPGMPYALPKLSAPNDPEPLVDTQFMPGCLPMLQQTFRPEVPAQPSPPTQTFFPAHIKHRRCSPKLVMEQCEQTCLLHATHSVSASAPKPSKSIESSSPRPSRSVCPQSSQLVG